jgi:hypothetical protein
VVLVGEASSNAGEGQAPLGVHLGVVEVVVDTRNIIWAREGRVPIEADGIQDLEAQVPLMGQLDAKVEALLVDFPAQGLAEAVPVAGVAG